MRLPATALIVLPLAVSALPAASATRAFPVPGFVKLRVEGPYSVRVRTGARSSVNARGPQSRIDKLMVESRGDTLLVSTEKSWNWSGLQGGKNEMVSIEITVPMLEAAELTGSGDVSIDRIRTSAFAALLTGSGDLSVARLETSRLRAAVTGSGDLKLAGHAGRADASVQGSGTVHAGGLSVDLLTASAAGSGDIDVGPTRTARVNLAGSGNISIAGRPSCTKNKVGSGEIRCGS